MILAGIDEAGLGPTIGPLVTASTAFAVPDDWQPDTFWQRLADAVCAIPSKKETRPAVADSKILYTSGGMVALELSLACMLLAAGKEFPLYCEYPECTVHPCYTRSLEPFPSHAERELIDSNAALLRKVLQREKAQALHMEARALFEPLLNHRYDSGLNKNQALLIETGSHLTRLIGRFPDQPMLIIVDKQGGRNDYLPFLTDLFPGSWIDTLVVGADESAYRLRRRGGDVTVYFRAKADRTSFPTALASLAAKYTRERSMAELNAWFCAKIDGLKPTAGYPGDAERWLDAVRKTGREKRLKLRLIIRDR